MPEVSAPAFAAVDLERVLPVRLADGPAQTVDGGGYRDEMNVVGHQAPRPDLDVVAPAPEREQVDVPTVVVGLEEGLLPAISPLGHVMGEAWEHCARDSCHRRAVVAGGSDIGRS